MAMDINNGLGPLSTGSGKAAGRAAEEARSQRSDAKNAGHSQNEDRVEISADAATLRNVAANLESQDSFDQARVADIKTAIENGEYPIDSRRLAEKFLQLESQIYQ